MSYEGYTTSPYYLIKDGSRAVDSITFPSTYSNGASYSWSSSSNSNKCLRLAGAKLTSDMVLKSGLVCLRTSITINLSSYTKIYASNVTVNKGCSSPSNPTLYIGISTIGNVTSVSQLSSKISLPANGGNSCVLTIPSGINSVYVYICGNVYSQGYSGGYYKDSIYLKNLYLSSS